MHLRLEGSKIRAVRPGQDSPTAQTVRKRESLFPQRSVPADVGFIYVVRSEHGLVSVGSTTKPAIAIARLLKKTPFGLEVSFLCFVSADACQEVEQMTLEAIAHHRANAGWFNCPAETVIEQIKAAAARLRKKVVPTTPETIQEDLRRASELRAVSRLGHMRLLREHHWKLIFAGLIGVATGIAGLTARWMTPKVSPFITVLPCIIIGMAITFVISRRHKSLPPL